MLKRLVIQNYALIETLDIEFPAGLVIITGETGAGKSIMLGALSLLLGGKGDVSVLGDSTKNCVVEGEFDYEGEELILRRVISPAGRTRSFINDEPATLATLTEISSKIVDIHAQHQHLLLTDESYQMKVLDYFACTANLLKEYSQVHADCLKCGNDLLHLKDLIAKREAEMEFKAFQLEKLQQAKLAAGELEELEIEHKQLANSEEIKAGISQAVAALSPMGVPVIQNFKDAVHLLQKSSNFVPGLQELAQRLESCRLECKDIVEELEALEEKTIVSPERLEIVEERLALLYSLMRKHSVSSVDELIEIRDTLQQQISGADEDNLEVERLEKARGELLKKREDLANKLTEARRGKIAQFEDTLQKSIRDLQMPQAIFKVELQDAGKYKETGKDTVLFLFSANGEAKLNALHKAASGGELSRVMLCLKSLMAEFTGMPTMIFDEIDTGVSGSIADKMGALIGRMGEKMQIFAITHLPQIASKRGSHLLVYKETDEGGKAVTRIKELDAQERIREVARMLSGSALTDAALENARVLLEETI